MDTEKSLVLMSWSVNGIPNLFDGPNRSAYHTGFFIDIVLPGLIRDIASRSRPKAWKGRVIHMDMALPHNSSLSQGSIGVSEATRLLHPVSSSEIALSDLIHFESVKGKGWIISAGPGKLLEHDSREFHLK
jgi:hypothetical protein